jgi:multidrug efflux pump subunit AcrA (membrane-fusion protein)
MKATLTFPKLPTKPLARMAIGLFLLLGIGGFLYYWFIYRDAQTADEPALQTAAVRQGDLILSISGTGTLAVSDETDLSFSSSGLVTRVYVSPGDKVKAGDLLAQIDPAEAQAAYDRAKAAYWELTSPAAIADAQVQLAQAETNLNSAMLQLEYLISPEVLYWETQISQGSAALETTRIQFHDHPGDQALKQQAEKQEAFLDFAQDKLADAWELYEDEYVPENFIRIREGVETLYAPTDMEITTARLDIDEARADLEDSQLVYDTLAGGSLPEDTDIDSLLKLKQAQADLEDARAVLDGTQIRAPIAGTILSVEIRPGGSAGSGTVITMADLSKQYVDLYLDQSDWGSVQVGYQAEVTFDSLTDQLFTGQVTQLDSQLYTSGNNSAIHGTVLLDSSYDQVDLPIGAAASVEVIRARTQGALLIPMEALHDAGPGQYAVFVATEDGLRLRLVEIGLKNELYAEVKSGLDAGDIVTTGVVKTN